MALAQDPLVGAGLDPLVREHFVAAHEADEVRQAARLAPDPTFLLQLQVTGLRRLQLFALLRVDLFDALVAGELQ